MDGAGKPAGTSGDLLVTDGRWLAAGWALSGAIITAVCAVNVLTITHEAPQYGLAVPLILEGSSALSSLAIGWLPWLVVRWTMGRPRRALALHIPAAVLYSALHVGGFIALRIVAYTVAGDTYRFGPISHWTFYELQKDVLAYTLVATTYWLIALLRRRPVAAPAVFDIRDGARIVRAPLADILAVTSAGNYAEFVLADGRRLLMRSPLGALEAQLPGFVRTHRSWLVNAARVSGLRPEGSGDYTVEVGALEAPLSRRFPQALARLRQG